MPKQFEVELYNVLTYNSGEPDFMEDTNDNLKIKNAVIISMGWRPENSWQSFLWGMLKHSLMKTHHDHFKRAENYYESKDLSG
jgi:hypothetical protein